VDVKGHIQDLTLVEHIVNPGTKSIEQRQAIFKKNFSRPKELHQKKVMVEE
jgi:hypothetical protein